MARLIVLLVTVLAIVPVGARSVSAGQDDPQLDGLFARLKASDGPLGARLIEQSIWEIWNQATLRRIMNKK